VAPHIADSGRRPDIVGFYEPRSFSIQYVVSDPATRLCAIVDPVLDFDEKSGATATRSADAILAHVQREGLRVGWILDTHPHADHLSAAAYLRQQTGAPTGIGARVVDVQRLWQGLYHLGPEFPTDGSQWDHLFDDGERFRIGDLEASVLFSPGHTLCSISYVVGDIALIHDTLFMPDTGSARADFPGGDAGQLWDSLQRIVALPASTRLFTGHDYRQGGREARWESTVAEQLAGNPHLRLGRAEFITMRQARDATLPMPRLILPALQVNIRGGRLPEPEADGRRYLKIPLNALAATPWD
jgi:glyoxylase-like metal-dependent hydrolase (beta-lactamase superfamily II)